MNVALLAVMAFCSAGLALNSAGPGFCLTWIGFTVGYIGLAWVHA